ncbi:rod-binding protein [Sulfitobacter geojensis]|uniref:rod-binding protein n=1 Tax=Sulfitobacter geojensis TaxID=1342299 RepID=UPI000468DF44|nr:rod-binding protein [Sulfitobacter geojensis]KHA50219.1 Flagellar protein FlgJ-like protein [Sulfitobacter geojensis]NYI27389.1 Rod binding domain-containing protein [Sulfitobacter geojensis]
MSDLTSLLAQGPQPALTKAAIEQARSTETAKNFEAVFLTQFVDEMMKTAGETAFGGKDQAEMWRSFMSEAVAKHLVEQGGLGLAGSVEQMMDAYTSAAKPQTPVERSGT